MSSAAEQTDGDDTLPHVTARIPLLETRDLRVEFRNRGRRVTAVDGVSYRLYSGETLAIVGESGAGKSVSCRALMGLLPDTASVTGSIRLNGKELLGLPERELRRHRGADIAMVFQDTDNSLNPTMRIGSQIAEAIRMHDSCGGRQAQGRAIELLRLLGISAPEERFRAYPHQLSGGMRQRVMIAIALAGRPGLLIADETTRALDAITQANIVSLLRDLQRRFGMALIFVSHDLALTASFADKLLVMYAGAPVEFARTAKLFAHPRMPYTKALLDAVPGIDGPRGTLMRAVARQSTNLADVGEGCPFRPSCAQVQPLCANRRPAFVEHELEHSWACWHPCGTHG